jgi:hypothetical protein
MMENQSLTAISKSYILLESLKQIQTATRFGWEERHGSRILQGSIGDPQAARDDPLSIDGATARLPLVVRFWTVGSWLRPHTRCILSSGPS